MFSVMFADLFASVSMLDMSECRLGMSVWLPMPSVTSPPHLASPAIRYVLAFSPWPITSILALLDTFEASVWALNTSAWPFGTSVSQYEASTPFPGQFMSNAWQLVPPRCTCGIPPLHGSSDSIDKTTSLSDSPLGYTDHSPSSGSPCVLGKSPVVFPLCLCHSLQKNSAFGSHVWGSCSISSPSSTPQAISAGSPSSGAVLSTSMTILVGLASSTILFVHPAITTLSTTSCLHLHGSPSIGSLSVSGSELCGWFCVSCGALVSMTGVISECSAPMPLCQSFEACAWVFHVSDVSIVDVFSASSEGFSGRIR